MAVTLTACHQAENDLFATARITFVAGESIDIGRIQGSVTFINLNSRQATTSSTFNGNSCQVTLLRGVYSIQAEGTLSYKQGKEEKVSQFRAHTGYVAFEKEGENSAELAIIFL